ncbi:unnamed protein product [Rotaria sp. Silwood2]|nr:unnamed protein product [Rotaria sp. Silwood2]CAF3001787.1 unnamed protein product [Rotaria sp. Silwood2]CAF3418239.1 unnamed protein product [Rotaria sp. Silwood2]CAF4408940.1 unnamed protein product [Rotaria sp. Silwood2]CAF4423505.1 unnamed protein product [Rotaria sp. Silwood2]
MSKCSFSLPVKQLLHPGESQRDDPSDCYDVFIKFQSAKNIPKMDLIGHADPYFVANIDEKISFTSTIVPNTASPQWNDHEWIVRNIPSTAKLSVSVYDKDDKKPIDDYIGSFKILNIVNYHPHLDGHTIRGILNRDRGRFYLSINAVKSNNESQQLARYTNDSPCRYSRHDDTIAGQFTKLNNEHVYSTFEIQLRRSTYFFRQHGRQYWSRDHDLAQIVFGTHPLGLVTKTSVKLAHRALYEQTVKHNESGVLHNGDELWKLVFMDKTTQRIKPCIYTYTIDDSTWRFSETNNKCFTDYVSKHVVLADASEYVLCAGQFHPRPKFGWNRSSDDWELVFDNASGTYTPGIHVLESLKELLLFNFPGLSIVTYNYKDPLLKESLEQLKLAAKNYESHDKI